MKKFFSFFIVVLNFSFFILHPPVFASGEFTTAYNVSYHVAEDGKTIVSQDISLKNIVSDLYATEYTVTLGMVNVTNITASDPIGEIKPEITRSGEKTIIHLKFNDKVVGRGKALVFKIHYETSELARRTGQIWEVNIPKVEKDPNLEAYNVSLTVPQSFGKPVSVKPRSSSGLSWTIANGSTSGINILFGNSQVFDFNLTYHLENTSISAAWQEIALPPDTAYQQIYLKELNPMPSKIYPDNDGNWLGRYELAANQRLDVTAQGSALIFLSPRDGFKTPLTKEEKEKYRQPQKYWETDDHKLKEAASNLKTPKDVYNYVVNSLTYNYKRVSKTSDRLGAKMALENPGLSLCLEFTDLFVALSRLAGIPAREIEGYALTDNPYLRPLSLVFDILHSWPEYYDEQKELWVSVDPTWEKTTGGLDFFNSFDFSHLALAIHGLSSEKPYPAGSYRKEGEGRDVEVTVGKTSPASSESTPVITLQFPKEEILRGAFSGKVLLKNSNQIALYNLKAEFSSSEFSLVPQSWQVDTLLPFGQESLSVEATPKNIFFWGKGKVLASLNTGQKAQSAIFLKPYELVAFPVILLATMVGIIFLGFLIKKKIRDRKRILVKPE